MEVPEADAYEQALTVEGMPEDDPVEVLATDLEVPVADAIEQHQPAPGYEEEDWRP